MTDRRLEVNFVDSSDDENSHAAALDVVLDGDNDGSASSEESPDTTSASAAGKHGKNADAKSGGVTGWLGNTVMRGIHHLAATDKDTEHEPFPMAQVTPSNSVRTNGHHGTSSSGGSAWGYGVHQHEPSTSSTGEDSLSSSALREQEEAMMRLGGEPTNYEINLRETVNQYLRTPSELYINIILASLKTGTVRVTADVFRLASGCPLLIKTFLDSGQTDLEDPAVQAVVQDELDKVLSCDPYENEILSAEQADYLRCLCSVKSARINRRQMVLMRYSGFEYIKMLSEYPYLRSNIANERRWTYLFFRVMQVINIISSGLGVIISLLYVAMVIWMIVHWFRYKGKHNNGYWTVITYVGGYVVSLVVSMRVGQRKILVYENQIWAYPNRNIEIMPIVPLYEILLVVVALRYELVAEKKRYFIIRYDLQNDIGMHHIIHGACHAIPMVIVQCFLFTEHDANGNSSTSRTVCFWILIGCCFASFFMAIFSYVRMVVFSHSCDSFGFAVLFIDTEEEDVGRKQRIKPSDIATSVLAFFTADMLIASAVTVFIYLLNLGYCTASPKVFLSVFFAVTGLTLVAMVLTLVYSTVSRRFGLFCIPGLVMMISYFPFTQAHDTDWRKHRVCSLYEYRSSTWMIPEFVMFACVATAFLVWLGLVMCELITGHRLQQQLVDNYFIT